MSSLLLFEKEGFISKELIQIMRNRFSHESIKMVLNYEECLTELSDFTPDVLMLGANIPCCNSLDFIEQIRQMYPGVCIILSTDYNIDEYRKEAILKGASHVVSKELWTGNEILALINTIFITKKSQVHKKAENPSVEIEEDTLQRFS